MVRSILHSPHIVCSHFNFETTVLDKSRIAWPWISYVPYRFHGGYSIECDECAYNRTAGGEALGQMSGWT